MNKESKDWKETLKKESIRRIESNDLFITHFLMDILPPERILRKLTYLTTNSKGLTEGPYQWGYSGFTELTNYDLEPQILDGSLIKFPESVKVTEYGQILWMDHEGIIYVADSKKPIADLEKRFGSFKKGAIYDSRTGEMLI